MDKEIERLINNYGNDVLKISYIYLKDRHLAEDAFQEVFIKVYKNFEKFQGKSSEKTWILSITMNVCKDILRNSWLKRVITFADNETAAVGIQDGYELESQVINHIEHKQLTNEVMNLPRKYKELIILYYYEDISTPEISKILKIPEGTVRSRLFRAREILKYNIDGKMEYEG